MVEKATEDPGCHNLPVAFKEVEWLRPRQFAEAEGSFIMWAMQNPRPQMDVEASPHAVLLSLGVETYGRWSDDSLRLVH